MTELKERLRAEGNSDEEVQTSSLSIKDRIRRLEEITKPNENDQETIHEGVAAAVPEEISPTKLQKSTKVTEGIRKETKRQEKIGYLDQEKRQGFCEERSRVQVPKNVVVTNLKKVEERNTKQEDEVTELKERLLAEENTDKEVQTCSLKLNERVEELEGKRTKPQSRKKKVEYSLIKEKEKIPCKERPQFKIRDRIRSMEGITRSIEADQGTIHESVAVAVCEDIEQTKLNEKINGRKEDLEDTRTKPKRQQRNLKCSLVNEPEKVPPGERSQIKGVTNLKKGKASKTTLEDEVTQLKKRLLVEEKTTKEAQSYSLILNDRIKALEDMRTELQSQQKKLKDTLDQEKDKVTRAEGSRSQVVTNLKKVEERNTKLEDEVTQLKERLLVEEKTTKEVQTSSLILNERIKDLEDMRTELVSHQKKLKDTLDEEKDIVTRAEASRVQLNERIKDLEDMRTELVSQQKKLKDILDKEKDKVTRAEASRVQAENDRKTLEQTKAMLEKEKEYLAKLLAAEERNETEMRKSLAKATTTCEKLQKAYEILQKEKEDLSEQLSTEKINTEIQIASFSKMTSHALPGSEKMAQRKDEDSYSCDETQSVITESTDSGIQRNSMHSELEYQDPFILNGRHLNTELKVAVTVTSRGANMHIPDTGVELDIPTGAAQGKVLIEMIILPFDKLDAPVSTFSCNSSVAVELLPNKMEFQRPVRLILPHCLKLTKNYQQTKNQVQVYVSHHKTGPPIWEEVSNAKYVLDETNCVISLKSFCWVKYEINNKIVEAKRIRVYTAGKRLKYTEDSLAEIEVGYHWDLPIARENLSVNDNMFVYQSKPFIFVKQGNLPLLILLTKTVPKQWTYITPKENPKVISFKCVADSKEKSCPFVIEKSEPTDRIPFCMFKVQQGNEDLELYIRFDD